MLALLLVLAGLGSHASPVPTTTPWPSIPDPSPYSTPRGSIYLCPVTINPGINDTLSTPLSQSQLPPLHLANVGDTLTLDYGKAVAGKPTFEITSIGSPYAQIEVKYTEAFQGLLTNQSDGPFAFSNGLANTFRVETFNITSSGRLTSYFIQGSQRWQSIKLIAGSDLRMATVGFEATTDTSPLDSKKGYFASSNGNYTDIWNLGPYTQQVDCFAPGSQTTTWDFDDEQGAYVRGQKPASSTTGVNFHNYTLAFETKIDHGGVGWRLDTEIDAIQATGPILLLTSDYPEGSFANPDFPPNTLVLGTGWSLQSQISLPGFTLDTFALPFNLSEQAWHTIETDSPGGGLYTVRVDGHSVASFNLTSYGKALPNPYIPGGYYKGFAFGPWRDQAAWYRKVTVTSGGSMLYSNPLTNATQVRSEYGINANDHYVCSDAGKRDRYSWVGDRIHSSRAIAVSTGQFEFVTGSADQAFEKQIASGQVPANSLLGPVDAQGVLVRTTNVDPLLIDYEFDFITLLRDFWMRSGDSQYIVDNWSRIKAVASFAVSRSLDDVTQLSFISGESGPAFGIGTTAAMIQGLDAASQLATVVGDDMAATFYAQQAESTRKAADALLWNATTQAYVDTINTGVFSMVGVARAALAGVGSPERTQASLATLGNLKVTAGYHNSSSDPSDTPIEIDPYYEGFLLEVFAQQNQTKLAQDLLDRTWLPMVRKDANYTGGYWEYVSADGTHPGLELFTAQTHFWGSYPTVFLTEYALGVRATSAGYADFVFAPLSGFDVEWNVGRVRESR